MYFQGKFSPKMWSIQKLDVKVKIIMLVTKENPKIMFSQI